MRSGLRGSRLMEPAYWEARRDCEVFANSTQFLYTCLGRGATRGGAQLDGAVLMAWFLKTSAVRGGGVSEC